MIQRLRDLVFSAVCGSALGLIDLTEALLPLWPILCLACLAALLFVVLLWVR